MQIAHPEQLLWLIAVLAAGLALWRWEGTRRRILERFAAARMLERLAADYSQRRAYVKILLLVLGLASLVVAVAGPRWGSKVVEVENRGVDVMLAVDLSTSMDAQDLQPSRLEVARREISDLLKHLAGNRVGLVGFAGTAFVFCPLTVDAGAARLFLEQMDTSAIPTPGTSIGDAIRAALDAFPKGAGGGRVLVLISDGEDHKSDPLGAAREAAKMGVVIHTVGLGSAQGDRVPERGSDGSASDWVRDASGNPVVSKMDEKTLREIASITGGAYVHAEPGKDMLAPVLASINGMEKQALDSRLERRYHERYQIFVAVGLALLALERVIGVRRRVPAPPRVVAEVTA